MYNMNYKYLCLLLFNLIWNIINIYFSSQKQVSGISSYIGNMLGQFSFFLNIHINHCYWFS